MRNNRRKHQQDALRWLMGVLVAALVASAATSAVFMAARRDPPPVDPLQQRLETSRQISQALAGELEALAKAHIVTANASPPSLVEAVYRTESSGEAGHVPMVAPDDNMLMKGAPTPWTLRVTSTGGQRKFSRIVDIRESSSLTSPGFIGVVEYVALTTHRQLAISGELPFQTPEGYHVITPAKYTELAQTNGYNVRPASYQDVEWVYTYEDWAPATPPPAELPEQVRRRFNETIAQCATSQPTTDVSKERLTFFYSLRERKWMPRP